MGRPGNLFSEETLSAGLPYFDYQRLVAREAILPWLSGRVEIAGSGVADLGCGPGGVLDVLRESGAACGLGIDRDVEAIASSPFRPDERFRLEVADLASLRAPERFDLVVLHDVLEHVVSVGAVLDSAIGLLADGGCLFVSFPPYRSAFGGHQHLAAGFARFLPYLHYLPTGLFLRLARPTDNVCMSAERSLADLVAVDRTRLTLAKAERAFAAAGLRIDARDLFLVRPEHTIRYGVPAARAGLTGRVPLLREVVVTGAYYLLRRGNPA